MPSLNRSNPPVPVAEGTLLPGCAALYDGAACGLLLTTADGTIRRINATACRWLGLDADELVGQRFQDLLTMGGRIFHQTHWAPLLQLQGSVAEVKLDLKRARGDVVPMLMNAAMRTHAGTVYHELALFVADDRHAYERELMAARKRAEQLLAEQARAHAALEEAKAAAADRAVFAEQMIGIVSHDLRNPLSTIRMGTQVLEMTAPAGIQQDVLANINRAGLRALRLINDLLDFTHARIGQGLSVDVQQVDLHVVVGVQVAELRQAYPARTLDHQAEGTGACAVDADRMAQLVGNLVSNAMAYGTPGSEVTVTTTVHPQGSAVSVHNLGPAIPEALRESLFQPMVRGTQAQFDRSIGLGLYIVAEIARAHGGSVDVSSSEQYGTKFTVRLPAPTPT